MLVIREFDPWKNPLCRCPPKYTLNPITGCGHKCIYCYITSYIRDGFNPRVKKDVVYKTERDLRKILRGSVIAISYSSDPYSPPEDEVGNMRLILRLMKKYGMRVLIATKSTLVTRDIDLLREFPSVVSISVTTLDSNIAKVIEPNAPDPSMRLKAVEDLIINNIPVSLRIDPIIPYLTDDIYDVETIVAEAVDIGINHIVLSVYKAKPDNFNRLREAYPDLEDKWRTLYYKEGVFMYGYRYPSIEYRMRLLKKAREIVKKYEERIGFNVCREGVALDDLGTYCDASHLLSIERK